MTDTNVTCPFCEGAGSITRTIQLDPIPFGGNDPVETIRCDECNGTGAISQTAYAVFLAELSPSTETSDE